MIKIIRKIPIYIIKFYQYVISPFCYGCCRFHPTCSNYAIAAFSKYGIVKGTILTAKRLLKCHPFGKQGYDPLD